MFTKAKEGMTIKMIILILMTRYYMTFDKEINYLLHCQSFTAYEGSQIISKI